MIKINRSAAAPPILTSASVDSIMNRLQAKIQTGEQIESKDFDASIWQKPQVRNTLHKMQNGKCCYCERKRELKHESDVEHFRPKTSVKEAPDHPGYWWLAYDWDNYLVACSPCNASHKRTHFPLLNENDRAYTPDQDISSERPMFINPLNEDPEDSISFDWDSAAKFVKATAKDDEGRGFMTINRMQLNRAELLEERAELLLDLDSTATLMKFAVMNNNEDLKKKHADKILNGTKADKKFAGFKRAFFHANMLSEFISTD